MKVTVFKKSHGRSGVIYKKGDVFEASEKELKIFSDRLSPVAEVQPSQENDKSDFFDLTLKDLKNYADENGIKYGSNIRKQDLLDIINGNQ